MAYAEKTEIAFDKSVGETISLIRKAGAQQIGQMELEDSFILQFRLTDRLIRFTLPLPTVNEMPTRDGRNAVLTDSQREARAEQRRRSLARALMLVIKAKLESVESGIETTEQAFLANVVTADGGTVYSKVRDALQVEYQSGKPTTYLLGFSSNP